MNQAEELESILLRQHAEDVERDARIKARLLLQNRELLRQVASLEKQVEELERTTRDLALIGMASGSTEEPDVVDITEDAPDLPGSQPV